MTRVQNPDPTRCVAQVSDHMSRWPAFYQCRQARTTGEWCTRHAPRTGSEFWYRVDCTFMRPKVIRQEFAGSTESRLINADGSRESKATQYYLWFATFEAAKAELVKWYKEKIEGLERAQATARRELAHAETLVEESHGE